ncbi:UNVERIFIED_CONTAM: hypothetical protein Slati_2155600 [Sesamum latifolium]|uniref:Reverse transcriptase domain-containing protein n=1 Tax=Sesamum latifolium TaxID=2727402 RepID=A0AAW2WTM9_9LAMI
MSSALFLLSMKYFSRLVKRRMSDSEFNFHPKCEKLKITHLLFADDLMLFSRGDLPSIHILMECIQNEEFHEILARTDFARGVMPVRYLRSPLAAQRLSVTDYSPLVDQITKSISKWTAKSLSYAAGWNLFDRLFRVWSATGSKFSYFQRRSLRKFTVLAGIFFGILREHRSLGRKSVIPRRKAAWASDTFSLGTWPSLPESYGTSTVRQTHCGYSGSTVSISEVLSLGLATEEGRFITPSTACRYSQQTSLRIWLNRGSYSAHGGMDQLQGA